MFANVFHVLFRALQHLQLWRGHKQPSIFIGLKRQSEKGKTRQGEQEKSSRWTTRFLNAALPLCVFTDLECCTVCFTLCKEQSATLLSAYCVIYQWCFVCRVLKRASVEQPDTVMQHKQFAAK